MGNNDPRLRLGKRADCSDVRLPWQCTDRVEFRTLHHRDVGLYGWCSNSPVQQRSADGYRCVGSASLALSTAFKTCPRRLNDLRGRLIFPSALCPGLLTRALLEYLGARDANSLLIVETFGSGAW